MIIVLKPHTEKEQISEVMEEVEALGLKGKLIAGEKPLIHIVSGNTRLSRKLLQMDRVQALVPTSGPRVRQEGRRFYPYHFMGCCAAFLLALGVLVFLAGYFPPGLGAPADLNRAPPADEVPVYRQALEQFLALFPERYEWLAWSSLCLGSLLLFFLPWLDRTRGERVRDRWWVFLLGLVLAAGILFLAWPEVLG